MTRGRRLDYSPARTWLGDSMPKNKPELPAARPATGPCDGQSAQALMLMRHALLLIDRQGGPAEVGARLDFAIHQLERWLATEGPAGP
jgi:hypothetical protein